MLTDIDFNFCGRTVVVSGARGFLGHHIVSYLASRGAHVLALDLGSRYTDFDTSVRPAEQARVTQLDCDVCCEDDLRSVLDSMESDSPPIRGLVCAAAYHQVFRTGDPRSMAFTELSLDAWKATLEVNLTGTFLCSKIFGSQMLAQKTGGSIVGIASLYGLIAANQDLYRDSGLNSNVAYAASKGGVIQLMRFIAAYWGSQGIRANALSPGGIENRQDSRFVQRYSSRTMLKRMGTPDDVVSAVGYLLSDQSSWVTGTNVVVDGGFSAW